MINDRLRAFFSRFAFRNWSKGLRQPNRRSTRRSCEQSGQILSAESRVLLSSVLVSGVTFSDTLAVAGEQDVYTFTAQKGDSVTIDLARTTTGYVPTIDVFSPSGKIVFDGFSGGLNAFDVLLNSFTETGTYTAIVQASSAGGTGAYNMTFVQVPSTQTIPVDEGALTSGVTRTGTITTADVDIYTFDAVPGNAVAISLSSITAFFAPEVDIFAPNGKIVYDGANGGTRSSNILLNGTNLPQSGTYTVLVKSGDGIGTGDYNLTYVKAASTQTLPAGEGALTSGVTLSPSISAGDIDVFTFQAAPGNAVTIDLARTTTAFIPEVDVFAPDGSLVSNDLASGPGSYDIFLNSFTQTGTYTVMVKANDGGSIGNYNLTYTKIPASQTLPAGEGALTSGVTLAATVIPGDIDLYTFLAVPGSAVTINVARTSLDYALEVDVFDPSGNLVYDGPTGGLFSYDLFLNTFTVAGQYTVQVKSSDGGSPGNYNLTYVKLPGAQTIPAGEGALTSGVTVNGTIDLADIDLYTFNAGPGSAVTLNLASTSTVFSPLSVKFYAEVDIFNPSGTLLYTGPSQGAASYDLLLNSFVETGTYTVMVKDFRGGDAGTYSMTYVQIGQPLTLPVGEGALTSGASFSGVITPGDIDIYTFTAKPGNTVLIDLASTITNYALELDIFNPDGTLVYDGPTTGGTGYDVQLSSFTQTGTYIVIVKSADGGSVGTYNMTYVKVPDSTALPAGEGALVSGNTVAGALTSGDIDVYTFNAAPGNGVKLDIARTTTAYKPSITIVDPTGKVFYTPALANTYNLTLPAFTVAGKYTVLLRASDGKSTGQYYIREKFSPVPFAAAPVSSASPLFSVVTRKQDSIL